MGNKPQATEAERLERDRILYEEGRQAAFRRASYLEDRFSTLFDAIAHGSDEHRAWLKKAIEDHFAGRPVERPHG